MIRHRIDSQRHRIYSASIRIHPMVSYITCITLVSVITLAGVTMASSHSMFNSAEEFYGGYRVQVATAPEFPQIGEPSTLRLRVTDSDFVEVDQFTMGLKFFYNDIQVDTIPPQHHTGGHWDMEYIWVREGNHVVEVYLYDIGDSDVLIYTFNMGTQSPFGYIFISAITVGALTFTGVVIYIYLPRILKKIKKS